MKSKFERDNQSLIKKLNDSEKKFSQILQILIKKQKELEKGMSIL
jgi:mRNA-degrading endonuclease YafQ of YafQ-DinJ toxin-antitoxin module